MQEKDFISVKNLVKEFPIRGGFFNKQTGAVHAVNNISFEIQKGETLGLVGESGCGKSTAGRCILGLTPPTGGCVKIGGINVNTSDPKIRKSLRKRMQIVFQNPFSSLNPRMTVEKILKEPLIIHQKLTKREQNEFLARLLELVGLNEGVLSRYPHEFSGGQRQRIGIARALSLNPEFIVADEPVSALDISIQAQILNLMKKLKRELNLTYLFISHDLSVIRYVCDRVAVMYLGEIVEIAPVQELFDNPKHPYTVALLSSVPVPEPKRDLAGRIILKGDIPSPVNPPSGCKFHTRCPHAMEICSNAPPENKKIGENHFACCHLLNQF
ncbi:MAG: dipeptide ABC transporter ATP-binding protein [Candidatus Gastranaerophilales bacterium]|nr:dipeptide ABC transporter ATP-binding protein [Candidatus Gastranaerophilales bacterium]